MSDKSPPDVTSTRKALNIVANILIMLFIFEIITLIAPFLFPGAATSVIVIIAKLSFFASFLIALTDHLGRLKAKEE